MTIYFYKATEQPYGCFSNFADYGFSLEGTWWRTSEHYYQAHKFLTTDPTWFRAIQTAATAKEAAALGRDRHHEIRPDWEQVKDEVMYTAVLKKFQTHKDIRLILVSTGEEPLVENSPVDYYWGCGADGTGHNQLGKILMQVRKILHQDESKKLKPESHK